MTSSRAVLVFEHANYRSIHPSQMSTAAAIPLREGDRTRLVAVTAARTSVGCRVRKSPGISAASRTHRILWGLLLVSPSVPQPLPGTAP